MSSSEPEQKGIFPKKFTSTRATIPSSSKKQTQPASSTAQPSAHIKVKRTSSAPKSSGERVNRIRGRTELSIGTNTEPSSPRDKASKAYAELGSPWQNMNELIKGLDQSLNDFEIKLKHNEKCAKEVGHVGDVLKSKQSSESISSSEEDYSMAPGSPDYHVGPAQRLVQQIKYLATNHVPDDIEAKPILSVLDQLSELMTSNEQEHNMRLKIMKDSEERQFAELVAKQNQIFTLQLQVKELKRSLKESTKPKTSDETLSLKNEVSHLKDIIRNRNIEIDQLTYKLIDANSYLKSLENGRNVDELNTDEVAIKNHFKCIKSALVSNQNILKLIQAKENKQA